MRKYSRELIRKSSQTGAQVWNPWIPDIGIRKSHTASGMTVTNARRIRSFMAIKFGTDGWRGLIDQDFNEENVKLATQAIANYFKESGKKTIIIGYDLRKKADHFAKLSAQVMAANEIKVYLVDSPCATPVTGWAILDKKADGAIMFTASHNPAEFLGLKYMTEEAMVSPSSVTDKFVSNIEGLTQDQIELADFDEATESGSIEIFDPAPSYLAKINELVDLEKINNSDLKVLLNPMHSVGVKYVPELLKGGKLKFELINGEPDSSFGGNPPEPIVEKNVTGAIEKMKEGGFDVCLSFDGDADRIGVIDEKGSMLTSLDAFLLLAYYFKVMKKMDGPVVKTLSNTMMVDFLGKKYGFEVFEVKVGFKYVGEKMKETGAAFGGEESGGSAISGYMLVRDAQVMNLFILEMMVTLEKPLSEILKMVKDEIDGGFLFKREDVHFPYEGFDELKTTKTEQLISSPPKEVLEKKVVNTRTDDGIKIFFEDGSWLLIRFSGTEPVLRLYAEAKTMEEVDQLIGYAKDFFQS